LSLHACNIELWHGVIPILPYLSESEHYKRKLLRLLAFLTILLTRNSYFKTNHSLQLTVFIMFNYNWLSTNILIKHIQIASQPYFIEMGKSTTHWYSA